MKTRICKSCGLRFVQKEKSTAKYCSDRCRRLSRSQNPNKNYHQGVYLAKSGIREKYDSGLEQQAMLMADAKGLSWTKSHGIRISYFNPALRRQAVYIPDFLIRSPEGYKLIELKPYGLVGTPVNQSKFEAARRWCRSHGYLFVVACSPNHVE